MYYQIYEIHLVNGDVFNVYEDYDLPFEKGLVTAYMEAKDDDVLSFTFPLTDSLYVQKKNILYISTGDVKEVYANGSEHQ